jgi:hypothetical protein
MAAKYKNPQWVVAPVKKKKIIVYRSASVGV